MAWQGFPFPARNDEIFYHANVLLEKIPKIIVQLPEKGMSLEGILTAVIAGGIPALVAWLAMRANNESLIQQLAQQERITHKTLTAELITSHRKKLVDDFRDSASKFLAYLQSAINVSNDIIYEQKKRSPDADKMNSLRLFRRDYFEKLAVERWKIKMLMDSTHPDYEKVVNTMSDIVFKLNNTGLYPSGYQPQDFNDNYENFQNGISGVIKTEIDKINTLN
ncbi:TPA: hypothetical protein QCH54_004011 [Enterobacter ludwigii]|uniref:hypothetical protein n=1 Tax=Enterobacter TaxID=547 RepID=UPI0006655089|nr:hypothetical protein [Enterobacter ludwigii]KZP52882.1 hypothetical protein A3N37_06765 [Enterobacter ludwigii]HDR2279942.1 hypothetical protein [Enterobacter ludwigii]HEM8021264.1 hypothetical protein [Enterobacter ludwigii]